MRRAGRTMVVGTVLGVGAVLVPTGPAQAGPGDRSERSRVVAALLADDVQCSPEGDRSVCTRTTLAASTDTAGADALQVTLTTFVEGEGRSGLLSIEAGSVEGEVALHVAGGRRARLAPTAMTLVTCLPEQECVPDADNTRDIVVSAALHAHGPVRTEVEREETPVGGCVVRTRSRTTTADAAGTVTVGARSSQSSGGFVRTVTRQRTRCR